MRAALCTVARMRMIMRTRMDHDSAAAPSLSLGKSCCPSSDQFAWTPLRTATQPVFLFIHYPYLYLRMIGPETNAMRGGALRRRENENEYE